jgi:hypothetical protein
MTTASKSPVPLAEIGAAVGQLRHHDVSPRFQPDLPLSFPMPHVQNDGEAGAAPGEGHRVDRR